MTKSQVVQATKQVQHVNSTEIGESFISIISIWIYDHIRCLYKSPHLEEYLQQLYIMRLNLDCVNSPDAICPRYVIDSSPEIQSNELRFIQPIKWWQLSIVIFIAQLYVPKAHEKQG